MANKRVLVDPPPFTALRSGLLSTAIDRTAEAPAHWMSGVTWQSFCPDADGTYDPCLVESRDELDDETTSDEPPADPPSKEETASLFLRGATPFTVLTKIHCSPVGFWARAQELGVQALTRVEAHQVERIFATGIAPTQTSAVETVYPHLQADTPLVDDTGAALQTVAEPVSDTPLSVVEAVGRLESTLASCYHGRGVIHVPAVLGSSLSTHTLVPRPGGATLETLLGNRISLGTGYPGDASDGSSTEDVAWIYATGAVFYYRSEIRVNQIVDSFDRAHNTVEMIAERTYVMGWDCCHLAVPVFIGDPGT